METPSAPKSLTYRLREGLDRIAAVMRADDWSRARAIGVNPAQLTILGVLDGRSEGTGIKALARQLGVRQPSATDSVMALARKGFVTREIAPDDARATRVAISAAGRAALDDARAMTGGMETAIAALDDDGQAQMLGLLVTLIRQMQDNDTIPIQRMCVSCRHFRPHAHAGAAKPHHCAFVDAAFGQSEIRIDCREHDTADPSFRAATWTALQQGSPTLQAKDKEIFNEEP